MATNLQFYIDVAGADSDMPWQAHRAWQVFCTLAKVAYQN
jgi:hypothetical protein